MRQLKLVPCLLVATLAAGCSSSDSPGGTGGTGTSSHSSTSTSSSSTASSSGTSSSSSTSSGTGGGTGGGTGTGGSTTQAPAVTSTTPLDGATGVALIANVSATFSEAMDPTTITASTFTVTSAGVAVTGVVSYANATAVFSPAAPFTSNEQLVATITTGARSAGGVAMAANHVWSFTTATSVSLGVPVDLRTAGNYVILAKTGISTVAPAAVVGDLGVSPAAATYITGFSLALSATHTYSTSSQVTGKVYAADYMTPTPANLTTAIGDMMLAFTTAAGRAPDVINLGAGNIGGKTLSAGVYKWGTGLLIPSDVTLTGSATDVWVFQIAGDLIIANATHVVLAGGGVPKNIFWQVSGLVDIGTTAHCEGVILTMTAATLKTGASLNGRLLAQTAVNLDSNAVAQPAP
jgi:hypothetical protein